MIALINTKSGMPSALCLYFMVIIIKSQTDSSSLDSGPCQSKYIRVTNSSDVFHSVLQNWTIATQFQCVRQCESRGDCDFLLWNSSNGNCLAFGSDSVTHTGIPVTDSTSIYKRALRCPLEIGYGIRSCRCLFLSTQQMTYSESKSKCASHGGRLFKSNTLELIALMVEIAVERGVNTTHKRVRIGLEDSEEENTFVWSDGSVMTNKERGNLFFDSQPDNHNGNEDCGEIVLRKGLLNDNRCDRDSLFACEVVPF